VRVRLHELVDALCDALRATPATEPPVDGVLPLATACERLGWSRRRLRAFCLERGVPVLGRRQAAAVDLAAVRQALASQPRVRHDAPSRELPDDLRDAFEEG
jgi:hypothetical protein